MAKNIPELSIIMPVFNSEKYIAETIRSLLAQSYQDFELIIINDGSEDNSADIISTFKDSRIRFFNNPTNKGIVYSRNKGLTEARGKYIAPFDADDLARKDKFEKQIQFLKKNPDFGMIGSWVLLIDKNGKQLKKKWKLNAPPNRIPSILLFRNYFAQPAVVIRREAVPLHGYVQGYDIGEDYIMWHEITEKFKTWNYPEYLIKCRIHPDSTMHREIHNMAAREKKIYKTIYKAFDFKLSEQQLDLLLIIKNNMSRISPDILQKTEDFLINILTRNKEIKKYDQHELMKVIYDRWLKMYLKAQPLSWKALQKFIFSPLQLKMIGNLLP